jgi:transketolase
MPEQAAKVSRIGIPDRFSDQYGSQDTLLGHWGITVKGIGDAMRNKLYKA